MVEIQDRSLITRRGQFSYRCNKITNGDSYWVGNVLRSVLAIILFLAVIYVLLPLIPPAIFEPLALVPSWFWTLLVIVIIIWFLSWIFRPPWGRSQHEHVHGPRE